MTILPEQEVAGFYATSYAYSELLFSERGMRSIRGKANLSTQF